MSPAGCWCRALTPRRLIRERARPRVGPLASCRPPKSPARAPSKRPRAAPLPAARGALGGPRSLALSCGVPQIPAASRVLPLVHEARALRRYRVVETTSAPTRTRLTFRPGSQLSARWTKRIAGLPDHPERPDLLRPVAADLPFSPPSTHAQSFRNPPPLNARRTTIAKERPPHALSAPFYERRLALKE
jgi:hypothetical protein